MPSNVQAQTSKATPLKFVNGLVIPPSFYNGCNYLSVLGFIVNPCESDGHFSHFRYSVACFGSARYPDQDILYHEPRIWFQECESNFWKRIRMLLFIYYRIISWLLMIWFMLGTRSSASIMMTVKISKLSLYRCRMYIFCVSQNG